MSDSNPFTPSDALEPPTAAIVVAADDWARHYERRHAMAVVALLEAGSAHVLTALGLPLVVATSTDADLTQRLHVLSTVTGLPLRQVRRGNRWVAAALLGAFALTAWFVRGGVLLPLVGIPALLIWWSHHQTQIANVVASRASVGAPGPRDASSHGVATPTPDQMLAAVARAIDRLPMGSAEWSALILEAAELWADSGNPGRGTACLALVRVKNPDHPRLAEVSATIAGSVATSVERPEPDENLLQSGPWRVGGHIVCARGRTSVWPRRCIVCGEAATRSTTLRFSRIWEWPQTRSEVGLCTTHQRSLLIGRVTLVIGPIGAAVSAWFAMVHLSVGWVGVSAAFLLAIVLAVLGRHHLVAFSGPRIYVIAGAPASITDPLPPLPHSI